MLCLAFNACRQSCAEAVLCLSTQMPVCLGIWMLGFSALFLSGQIGIQAKGLPGFKATAFMHAMCLFAQACRQEFSMQLFA